MALFGYRLAGPAAAIASCLILFGLRDLVLVHGLRSNNMEAPLVAAYTGGLYHFLRWRHAGARRDALITGAWFTLAFLTKFVAAAFLPLVAPDQPGAAPARPAAQAAARLPRRLAVGGGACVVGVSAPWFVYEYWLFGDKLIETIFLQHVFARFTGALDPRHLHPWDYYYLGILRMLTEARCQWLVAAGAAILLYRVVRRRDGLAWTLVVWGVAAAGADLGPHARRCCTTPIRSCRRWRWPAASRWPRRSACSRRRSNGSRNASSGRASSACRRCSRSRASAPPS